MVTTIKKGTSKQNIEDILRQLFSKKKKASGIDAYKYCGVIKLKDSPYNIQKKMRREWD